MPPEPPWVPRTFLGPQEALGALASLWQPWVFSQTQGPCFPCSPSPPSLPLTPSCSLSLPGSPWAPGTFLGPQEALGAFRSLWQPWVFSQTQRPCFPCSSHPLAPSHSLGLSGPMGPSWGLRKPWEPLADSGALLSLLPLTPLLPLAPSHPLSPPEPPLVSLGPWNLPEASGSLLEPLQAFGSIGSSVRLRGLASLAPPSPPLAPSHSLSPPEPPWASLDPWDLPGASASLGSPCNPSAALGFQSDSAALLPLLPITPLTPCHSLSPPEPPWAPGTFLGPQEALGAFRSLGQLWMFLPKNFLAHGGDLQRPFVAM